MEIFAAVKFCIYAFIFESTLHCISGIWKCNQLFLLCSEFLGCFSGRIPLSTIVLGELYLEGVNAQVLPGFQPLLRKSVLDELCELGL